ncbi:response regulator [Paenibacillus brevis]|uniref:Response regulator transcription factor n=1 Tax=Paenibacillus brevis TaxID=2841508 RepID=A0ABS6FYT6_9BACL|nr:response regulator transcription factor [Paenibacillus brevis]MBU5674563.1 response regulator transcription factor [Paenibacillus brevis]
MNIRVIIADDNSFIREGMRIILNTYGDFEVLAAVADGAEAVDFCREHEVDVALLDVRMPNMNGVEATRILAEETKTKPLILTTFDDDEYIVDAVRYGAKGYLLKNNDPERICDAIRSVYHGHNVLQNVILDKLKLSLGENRQHEESPAIDKTLFTERELEVMSRIAKGLSNKEIAKELYISEGTVANYITSVLSKTSLEHRTQIAIYYLTGRIR